MNVEFIGQLIEAMEDGISRLEKAVRKKNIQDINKLKVFVFDIHLKIAEALRT